MIKGIHHVSIRCGTEETAAKVKQFYTEVLGLPIKRDFGMGAMYDTGNGLIEVFFNRDAPTEAGAVQHFALATDNVDEDIEKIRNAGYTVTVEPRDGVLGDDPPYPIRVAFWIGPVGETIELFQER